MFHGSYYNPYMFQSAMPSAATSLGVKGLFQKFNFGNFLTSAGKTLNVVNQAIPIFYQVKPMFNNARTMMRVMGAVRSNEQPRKKVSTNKVTSTTSVPTTNVSTSYQGTTSSTTVPMEGNLTYREAASFNTPTFFI